VVRGGKGRTRSGAGVARPIGCCGRGVLTAARAERPRGGPAASRVGGGPSERRVGRDGARPRPGVMRRRRAGDMANARPREIAATGGASPGRAGMPCMAIPFIGMPLMAMPGICIVAIAGAACCATVNRTCIAACATSMSTLITVIEHSRRAASRAGRNTPAPATTTAHSGMLEPDICVCAATPSPTHTAVNAAARAERRSRGEFTVRPDRDSPVPDRAPRPTPRRARRTMRVPGA
jgi:hypothetical protein